MPVRTPRRSLLSSEINVTPMADIMLVLLIIFMITTPLLQNEVSVNLPKAQNPLTMQSQGAIVVALTRDGRIFVGKMPVSETELAGVLSKLLESEIDRTMFLKADTASPYGRVVRLVDECRKLGVERIGLMAEKELEPIPK